MGGILRFAEVEGFLGDTARRREMVDPETIAWRTLAEAWALRYGERPIKIDGVGQLMSEIGDPAVFGPLLTGDAYAAKAKVASQLAARGGRGWIGGEEERRKQAGGWS
jgi:hypothetical protein